MVKFKDRKQYRGDSIPKAAKIGRTYDDFLLYIEQENIMSWVEMDTVMVVLAGKSF